MFQFFIINQQQILIYSREDILNFISIKPDNKITKECDLKFKAKIVALELIDNIYLGGNDNYSKNSSTDKTGP